MFGLRDLSGLNEHPSGDTTVLGSRQARRARTRSTGDWPNTFRTSRLIPAVEYIRAQRARTLLVAKFEKFMADWDVLVMPPNTLLTTTNLTGSPQVVMKCGFTGVRGALTRPIPDCSELSQYALLRAENSPA